MSRIERRPTRRAVLRAGAGGLAAVAGATGAASAQSAPFDGWLSDTQNFSDLVDRTGESEVRVIVGASGNRGNLAFGPPAIRVDPGTTVVWEWNGKGGAHNVHAVEGADFTSGDPVQEAGTTFSHTFEGEGVVKYQCDPHEAVGMRGVVVVGDVEVQTPAAADGGGGGITLPGGGFGGLFFGMVYAGLGLVVLMVLAPDIYDSVTRKPSSEAETGAVGAEHAVEGAVEEPVRELGHHDYDPTGTAALIVAYFLVLVLMWVFMYFVEFLGNGPTVVG